MRLTPAYPAAARADPGSCAHCGAPLSTDDLTGLPDRAHLMAHLQSLLTQPAGPYGRHLAVLFCDIDRFRVINDSFGRDAGDLLLAASAQRLYAAVHDSCGPAAIVARLAADEFIVVCPKADSAEVATGLANRIHVALAQPITLDHDRVRVHVSVGIAVAEPDEQSANELVQHAEAACARAKTDGRDRIETFDAAMRSRARERLHLEMDLARAPEGGELRLHYQPILHLASNRVTGLEALVRWQHPERGLLQPADFIPLAEETGLIHRIGEWVMDCAFRQSKKWNHNRPMPVRVGVNVSARQISQDGFVDSVAALLERLGPEGLYPHIEITESALMVDPVASAQALRDLRALGVRISLDDFGTGYSSLAYLQRFPVDVLKIDQSFISGIDRNERDRALVRAIVQLGHALDLLVLAEGVETAAQRRAAVELGCDLLQGFAVAPPAPAELIPLPDFLPR